MAFLPVYAMSIGNEMTCRNAGYAAFFSSSGPAVAGFLSAISAPASGGKP